MKKWTAQIGRAIAMGLAWAIAWVPVGALVGGIIVGELEPEHIGGPLYASLLCGAAFATVTGIATGRRTLAGLSLSLAGGRGALGGLLAGALWLLILLGGGPDPQQLLFAAAVVGGLTLLSAISGIGTALVARLLNNSATTPVA